MRILFLKDPAIPQEEYEQALQKNRRCLARSFGVKMDAIEFKTEERSFADITFANYYSDADGSPNRGIAKGTLRAFAHDVVSRYGKRRFDHIVLCVPSEYWIPSEDNIWGWNMNNEMYGLEIQQCRFDTESARKATRIANSAGTLYHETKHAFDQFTYRLRGVSIAKLLGTHDWDNIVVHGHGDAYTYVSTVCDNADVYTTVGKEIWEAYQLRRRQYESDMFSGVLSSIVEAGAEHGVIQKFIENYRRVVNILTHTDQKCRVDFCH